MQVQTLSWALLRRGVRERNRAMDEVVRAFLEASGMTEKDFHDALFAKDEAAAIVFAAAQIVKAIRESKPMENYLGPRGR